MQGDREINALFSGIQGAQTPLGASAKHMSYQNPVFSARQKYIKKTSLSAHVMFLVTRDDANSV